MGDMNDTNCIGRCVVEISVYVIVLLFGCNV